MSSPSFAGTVDLTLRTSIRAVQALFLLHAIPVAAVPFAMDPGLPLLALLLAFALSWFGLRRHPALGFGPQALTRLTWHADGRWVVHSAGGLVTEAELLASSFQHPALLVLNFRLPSGRRRTRLVFGDEAEPEPLRRLRARLATASDRTPVAPG